MSPLTVSRTRTLGAIAVLIALVAATLAITTAEASASVSSTTPLVATGSNTYRWGEDVTMRGVGYNGASAGLRLTTQWRDKVIGVVGGRWDDQIDYTSQNGGQAEGIIVTFDEPATDITLVVGMLGAGEGGSSGGKPIDESGIWTAYDAAGRKISSGPINPDVSALGIRHKVPGSYGQFPIDINASRRVKRLEVFANPWGNGAHSDKPGSGGSNNSDFGIVALEYQLGATNPTTTTNAPTTTTTQPSTTTTRATTATNAGTTTTTQTATTTTTTKATTPPPAVTGDVTLSASAMSSGPGARAWGDGVWVSAFAPDGASADVASSKGGIGVGGGRYDYQIDWLPTSGSSEMLLVSFDTPVDDLSFDLHMIETAEWKDLNETGAWKAVDADGAIVGSGTIESPDGSRTEAISVGSGVARLMIEATAYGHGAGPERSDNNSDFALTGISFTRTAPTPSATDPTTTTTTTRPVEATTTTSQAATTTTTRPVEATTTTTQPARTAADRVALRAGTFDPTSGAWANSGVVVSGVSASGSSVPVAVRNGGIGVDGGRYDFQVDWMPATGTSEQLVVSLPEGATDVAFTLQMVEISEWVGLNETGVWTAYGPSGDTVATGRIAPTSTNRPAFSVGSQEVSRLVIEATAYGHGVGSDRTDNNSDFALTGLTFTQN